MFVQLKSSVKNEPQKAPSTTMSRAVTRELISSSVYKRQQRDLTSSKLNVKGPKQAEALQVAEIHDLRRQLTLLPIDLKEDARINYQLTLMNNQRSLQDFQCRMLANVEVLLKSEMTDRGEDHRKYRIGGHEDATYERFFRIEPSRFMSKPQFTTALRMVFGENMIKSAPMINKLYESFDLRRVNEMDWRSMLYLLNLLMQPTLPCIDHIKIGYSLYSSVGCLDNACTEKLHLGVLKDLLATPVQLSMRPTLTTDMDLAWQQLMQNDEQVILYSAKAAERHQKRDTTGKGFDPNELKIPFRMFLKILTETSMQRYFEVATVYGRKDPRPWSYHLEETFYHPILLQRIKALRREYRNEDIATWFLAQQDYRKKRFMYTTWVDYVRRRTKLRVVLIAAEIRATIANYHVFFNHIRKVCMEYRAAVQCQRLIRGFISRQRRHFIKRLQRKVVKMQSSTRQYLKRLSYSRQKMRLYWAAVTIQRVFRGRVARVRVGTIVQAIYDQRVRQLAKDRANWMLRRMTRAMMCIKRYWHRYVKRKKMLEAMRLRDLEEEISEEMQRVQEEARIAWELYKLALSQWYEERKIRYDEDVLTELHTKEQRKLLIERRAKLANEIKLRKKQEHDARLAKLEEEQIEFWIKNWEETIVKRGEQRRQKCRNALRLPETPEEIQMKKDIAKRTKAHIKDVLRRADMQKIPMEIPEAFNIAQDEIIEEEVQSAMAQARQEMKDDGMRIEEEKRRKAEQQRLEEIAEKQRKAKWAVVTIQTYARVYLARRKVRHRAYERYSKFFDREFHEYYYQDNLTKQCFWSKPKSLGSYDIIMESYWMVLPIRRQDGSTSANANANAIADAPTYNMPTAPVLSDNPVGVEKTFEKFYFYQPSTWKQTWVQPEYTVMCALCQEEFAQHYVHLDYQCYCTSCMQKQVYEVWTQGEYPVTLRDILFQNFNGGRTDASYMDMTDIAVQDFYTFIMKLDPSLQMSAEEEEEENRRAHIQKRRKRLSQELHHCLQCKQQIATMFCPECPKHRCIFCGDCDGHVHRKGRKKLHKRQRLLLEQARSALKAAAEELEKPTQSKLPNIGRLGKSMMTSMFGKSGFFGKDDDSDDDSDGSGSSDGDPSRRRDKLGRQGSATKLPAIMPANAEGGQLQRQATQRIDGQESSSASSDSEATKERKAKEKARLAKEAARQERLKKKKQQREEAEAATAAGAGAGAGGVADEAASGQTESTSDGETAVSEADGGDASQRKKKTKKKSKDGTKTKKSTKEKKKLKKQKQSGDEGDASETDALSSATGGTETSKKKAKAKKKKTTKAKTATTTAATDESDTPTPTDSQRLPAVQQPGYDGVTNSGRMDVDNQRPFSSPETKPRRVKSKKSPKKTTSASSGNGGGGSNEGGLKLPPITSERSRTAPAAMMDTTPPLDGTDRPTSDMDDDDGDAAPRQPKQKKKQKTKTTTPKKKKASTAAGGGGAGSDSDVDPAKVYDGGDESSVFTHGEGDDSALSSSKELKTKKKKRKKIKQKEETSEETTDAKDDSELGTQRLVGDRTAMDAAPPSPSPSPSPSQQEETKKKKKKKKTKPSSNEPGAVSDTDMSQLTMNDSDFRDTRDSDFSDHQPPEPRHTANADENDSTNPSKKKKKKKQKKLTADNVDDDGGNGDASRVMDGTLGGDESEPSTAVKKKKKKSKKKATVADSGLETDGSDAEGLAAFGERSNVEQAPAKKKKKTKKVISGVLAGLGGDVSDMDSSLATGMESTASKPKNKKKKKNKKVISGVLAGLGGDVSDMDSSLATGMESTASKPKKKKSKKKKASVEGGDDDGYLSGSTAFSTDASPLPKKKKKKKSPGTTAIHGDVSSDGDLLMSDDVSKEKKKKKKSKNKKNTKTPVAMAAEMNDIVTSFSKL